jgi:membrane-associated phospholipid phosphatase
MAAFIDTWSVKRCPALTDTAGFSPSKMANAFRGQTQSCISVILVLSLARPFPHEKMASKRIFYLRFSLLFYAAWMSLHILVGNISIGIPARDLSITLDSMIPLVPWFVWIYLFAYLFPLFLLLAVRDWHSLNITFLSIIILNIFAYPVFLNFPVTFDQPALGNTLAEKVLSTVYDTHLPPGANNLPSLHVALALTAYCCYRKELTTRAGSSLVALIVVLITLSTLFVKEHIVADVAAGILWAIGGWALAWFLYPRLVDTTLDPVTSLRTMMWRLLPIILTSILLVALVTIIHWFLLQ